MKVRKYSKSITKLDVNNLISAKSNSIGVKPILKVPKNFIMIIRNVWPPVISTPAISAFKVALHKVKMEML